MRRWMEQLLFSLRVQVSQPGVQEQRGIRPSYTTE